MNKHKFLIPFLTAALSITACKKNDLLQSTQQKAATATLINNTQWKSVSAWSGEKEENTTVYSGSLSDTSINAGIASKGLVLVYKKSGNTITALPAEVKTDKGSYFWYYQVSQGNITLVADAEGTATTPKEEGFTYFAISADKLKTLETQGYTKANLMTLTYENASAILK